jgi:hypothetical protein
MSWRDHIKVHPAASLFPPMSKAELVAMAADIEKNGLHEPVTYYQNPNNRRAKLQLLDGCNRLDAIELIADPELRDKLKAQVDPYKTLVSPYWRVITDDPYEYARSANLHRRHLTRAQQQEVIAKMITAKPDQSNRQIAAMTKASPTTVGAVRAKLEQEGVVSKLDTRTGADGVKQPASKPKREQLVEPPLYGAPQALTDVGIVHGKFISTEDTLDDDSSPFDDGIWIDSIENVVARLRDFLSGAMEEVPPDEWPRLFWRLHEEMEAVQDRVFDLEEYDDSHMAGGLAMTARSPEPPYNRGLRRAHDDGCAATGRLRSTLMPCRAIASPSANVILPQR